MTKTQYFVAASLDGYIADAHGKIDWLTGFESASGIREHYEAFLADVGALAMGARTYDFLLSHVSAWPYGSRPTFVFSHRDLPALPGADIRFVRGDVAAVRRDMLAASGGKHLWLVGGGHLAEQFQRYGWIDELWLSVMPLVLGAGAPTFGAGAIDKLVLQGVKQFGEGVVELRYRLSDNA